MNSSVTWCVASVPTVLWANLLGYEGSDEEKIDQLWATLLKLCRIEVLNRKIHIVITWQNCVAAVKH